MDSILKNFKKAGRAVFRTREYAALTGKPNYARLVLHRLKERKELIRIRNGWWAFPESDNESIACEISKPAYLSFHSALYIYGLTTQIPKVIQIAVARNAKRYAILKEKVKEYRVKKELFKGFYSKEGLLIGTPEKAFADCLNLPRTCPGIILKEALNQMEVNKVESYLTKAGLRRFKELLRDARKR